MIPKKVHHSSSVVLFDEYQWNLVALSVPATVQLAPIILYYVGCIK